MSVGSGGNDGVVAGNEGKALNPSDMLGRRGARRVVDAFAEKDLLVDAGALAFRAFLALIPALLFIVGVLGFFGFDEVWKNDIAPDVKASVSPASFRFFDEAVTKVLGAKSFFWITAGAALTAWEASAIVRAAGNVMNKVYEVSDDDSSFRRELAESIPVGAAAGLLIAGAVAALRLGPIGIHAWIGDGFLPGLVSIVVCWSAAATLFFAAVAIIVRFAPAIERPPRWLSFGAATIVAAWALMSLLFGVYLSTFASYGSIFGSLATVFVLIEYLYLVSVVFLGGIVIDSLIDGKQRHD